MRKAETEACKLTLGHLRYGGVWLTPLDQIGDQLAVAEGIETALSVIANDRVADGCRSECQRYAGYYDGRQVVHRLWIAADNDRVGLEAASSSWLGPFAPVWRAHQSAAQRKKRLQRHAEERLMTKMFSPGVFGDPICAPIAIEAMPSICS